MLDINHVPVTPPLSGKWNTQVSHKLALQQGRTRSLLLRKQQSEQVDWSTQSEGTIRREMERRIEVWLTKKLEPKGLRSA